MKGSFEPMSVVQATMETSCLRKDSSDAQYQTWRAKKLEQSRKLAKDLQPLEIKDLAHLTRTERAELLRRCEIANAVLYYSNNNSDDSNATSKKLLALTRSLGLVVAEKHRSENDSGAVEIRESKDLDKAGYIPYTRKPINWHTDGYYNAVEQKIRSMVLHCVRAARVGGTNQILDPEIAYIILRDKNPAFMDALMHPQAMIIPQNTERDGSVRPQSVGPVFSFSSVSGQLEMRFTARTRSIKWRNDSVTQEAVSHLMRFLSSDDEFVQTVRLEAGCGILCNNSLHNRSGFDSGLHTESERLLLRIRFNNHIVGD